MKNLWIVIAVLSALACGFLGYKIASRKPVYLPVSGERPKAADVGDVIDEALKVDPKLIIGTEEGRLTTGLKELRGVAVGPEDRESLWKFRDEGGRPWTGRLRVDPVPGNQDRFEVSLSVERAD